MNASVAVRLHVERHVPVFVDAGGSDNLPIVMLHGWGMNLRVFDLLRADLTLHESWAIDLPGHGQSPWWPEAASFDAQLQALLAMLPSRCVLLGWSLGAKFALAIAASAPQRVAALALLCASPRFAQSTDWPHGMATSALRAFDVVLAQDWRQTLQDFIALQLRGSRNAEESRQVIEVALAAHGAPQREALLADMALLNSVDQRALVQRITQPTLLVAGQNDRITPPGAARWLAQQLPHASLLEVPRAGHAPMISHHAEVAAAIQGLLADLPQDAPS